MRKGLRGALCAVLAVLLLSGIAPGAAAKGKKKKAVEVTQLHISSAAELCDLASECSLDTWSDNVHVTLDNDISLAGIDFSPIPIFNGTFDGAGHTIYDLDLTAPQSPCGLFLETGEKADIRDLSVSGVVSPGEDDDMVGGVVGRNRGTLTGCSFSGRVTGRNRIGGLVGVNEASGLVTGCVSTGSVQGVSCVGGVCGLNQGTLLACENDSYVNTEVVDPALRLDQLDASNLVNLYRSITTDTADITTDIGGVAGGNEGFVEQCRNTGTVGYLHIGYNVGGIAGRSSGSVDGCTNAGDVCGRKNTGGVVGRAEPMVEVSQAQNLIAGLNYRLSALNNAIDAAIGDAGEDAGGLVERLSGLSGYLTPVHSAIAALDLENPDSFAGVRSSVSAAVSGIYGQLDSLSRQVDGDNRELTRDMQNISDSLRALSGTAMETVYYLSGAKKSEPILSDDSVSEADTILLGRIADSVNEGEVRSDSNAGGIAGALTLEEETDLDEITGGKDNDLIRNRYSLRAVITRCINRGAVTAKRECAGGVCGRLDLGLVTNCANCGGVALEDGDYAGGVCGLSCAEVRNCCVKCALSGRRYVGGVLGNGTNAANSEEHPSSVSGCYTLVSIQGNPQFSGAVSGGGAGEYKDNYFVPAGFAGLDKRSVHGMAEPMTFSDFSKVKGIPEECRSFTLSFVVDGETVKTVLFDYGASFDRSVFPEAEKRAGAYPVWDRTDLTDLRFDTVVTAEYRTDKTALSSDLLREDGRSAVLVEGQFQEGDTLLALSLPVSDKDVAALCVPWKEALLGQLRGLFSGEKTDWTVCTKVEEELLVTIPDDGQSEHALRLLPPDGSVKNQRVYLRTGEGWTPLPSERFGSYLTVTIRGSEAMLCLARTFRSWQIVALAAAVLIASVLMIVLAVKLRKKRRAAAKTKAPRKPGRLLVRIRAHKKAAAITALCLTAAIIASAVGLNTGRVGAGLGAARLLQRFASEETDVRAQLVVTAGERETRFSATAHRISSDGKMISCVDKADIPLYISDGKVYLENGRGFRLSDGRSDQSSPLELAARAFAGGAIEKTKTADGVVYSASVTDAAAAQIPELFLGDGYGGSVRLDDVTVRLTETKGDLTELSFAGQGVTEGGDAFRLTAELKPEPLSARPSIPRAVLSAMSDDGDVTEVLTEDLLSLFSAWIKYDEVDSADALMTIRAEGGTLALRTDCSYYRQRIGKKTLHCVSSPLFTAYFTDEAACDENGQPLLREQSEPVDAARLIGAARELAENGRFTCEHRGEKKIYTISLAEEDAKTMAETLLPTLRDAGVVYGESTVRITVENGALTEISFQSAGSMKIVTREVDVAVEVSFTTTAARAHTVPAAVRRALLG